MTDAPPLSSPVITPAKAELTVRYGDHLFISGDSNSLNDQHLGTVKIPDADKAEWLRIAGSRWQMCHDKGIPFLFILAPDKQTVYRHLLPPEYKHRQAEFFTELPYVVDPAPTLAALAKITDVYPRTDSHWNHLGAFIAAQAIEARLGRDFPEIVLNWAANETSGDLGNKVTPPETSPRLTAKLKSTSTLIYDNVVPNNGRIRIHSKSIEPSSAKQDCLVIFGDSFSYDLVHFLKETFHLVVHIHSFSIDHRLLDALNPTVVLSEITERFTLRIPRPQDGTPLDALWEDKVRTETTLEMRLIPKAPDPRQFPQQALDAVKLVDDLFEPYRMRLKTV